MPKTLTHEFPLKPSADGKGFQIIDDFTRPNPLDHTRFDQEKCEVLVVTGWTGPYGCTTFINPSRVNAEQDRDEARVLRQVTRHNEQVFQMLNAALNFLASVPMPETHQVTLTVEETTIGVPLPYLYGLEFKPKPLCNSYNAKLVIESKFGISGITINGYEYMDNGRGNVDAHTVSDSQLSRQLRAAAEKSADEKVPIAA